MFVFRQTFLPAARFAGAVLVIAAALAGTAGAATRDFYFDRPGSDRGLVQNTVTAFAQDTQGYVWVATQGGLHRYDGQRYLPYRHNPRDAASLPDSHITALAMDGDRALWVGTYSEYLSRLDLADGRIRHGAKIQRWRDDKDPADCKVDQLAQ